MKKITLALAAVVLLFAFSSFKPLERSKPSTRQSTIEALHYCDSSCDCRQTRIFSEEQAPTGAAAPVEFKNFDAAENLLLYGVSCRDCTKWQTNEVTTASTWKWHCGAGNKDDDDGNSRDIYFNSILKENDYGDDKLPQLRGGNN